MNLERKRLTNQRPLNNLSLCWNLSTVSVGEIENERLKEEGEASTVAETCHC